MIEGRLLRKMCLKGQESEIEGKWSYVTKVRPVQGWGKHVIEPEAFFSKEQCQILFYGEGANREQIRCSAFQTDWERSRPSLALGRIMEDASFPELSQFQDCRKMPRWA